jgi:hypothetical protein
MTETSPSTDKDVPDSGSLRLLAVLHFAAACLCGAGIGLLHWQYSRMHGAFLDLAAPKIKNGGDPSLEEFFVVFRQFYVVFGAVVLACGMGDLLSGVFIRMRRYRAFSLFVACLNCLLVPLGTMLGAFTVVVLLRESVRGAYASRTAGRAGGPAVGGGPARTGGRQ